MRQNKQKPKDAHRILIHQSLKLGLVKDLKKHSHFDASKHPLIKMTSDHDKLVFIHYFWSCVKNKIDQDIHQIQSAINMSSAMHTTKLYARSLLPATIPAAGAALLIYGAVNSTDQDDESVYAMGAILAGVLSIMAIITGIANIGGSVSFDARQEDKRQTELIINGSETKPFYNTLLPILEEKSISNQNHKRSHLVNTVDHLKELAALCQKRLAAIDDLFNSYNRIMTKQQYTDTLSNTGGFNKNSQALYDTFPLLPDGVSVDLEENKQSVTQNTEQLNHSISSRVGDFLRITQKAQMNFGVLFVDNPTTHASAPPDYTSTSSYQNVCG